MLMQNEQEEIIVIVGPGESVRRVFIRKVYRALFITTK